MLNVDSDVYDAMSAFGFLPEWAGAGAGGGTITIGGSMINWGTVTGGVVLVSVGVAIIGSIIQMSQSGEVASYEQAKREAERI